MAICPICRKRVEAKLVEKEFGNIIIKDLPEEECTACHAVLFDMSIEARIDQFLEKTTASIRTMFWHTKGGRIL